MPRSTSNALSASPLGISALKPLLIVNEDNDHYFKQSSDLMTREALESYIDQIGAGGAVTHFFMCPCGQRTSYDSRVWEPIWAGIDDPDSTGKSHHIWPVNCKLLHDRGIDPYDVWIRRCRQRGISPWLSMRMNDVHFVTIRNYFRTDRFWTEHPELRRYAEPRPDGDWNDLAFDYSKSEVRAHHLAMVRELLERYDADGIELDWMRFWRHLSPGQEREQAHVLTEFMASCRTLARSAEARWGHKVRIGVKVPFSPEAALAFGMDVEAWTRDDLVDLVVPCNFWGTADFDLPYASWLETLGPWRDRVTIVPGVTDRVNPSGKAFAEMDCPALYGWADLMYRQGAPGVYLFNFPYLKTSVRQEIYAHGLSPDGLSASMRRYLVTYHDCVPAGMPSMRRLPLDVSADFVINTHFPVLTAFPKERLWVTLGFAADGKKLDELSLSLNGIRPMTCHLATGAQELAGISAQCEQVWTYEFPVSALTGQDRLEGRGANTTGTLLWCEIKVIPAGVRL